MEAISISTITCRLRPNRSPRVEAYYNYGVRPIDVSDEQGISVFCKNERGDVFHTYSCHARGIDMVNGAYQFLDLVPKGRDEDGLDVQVTLTCRLATERNRSGSR